MKQFACGILVCFIVGSIAAPFSARQAPNQNATTTVRIKKRDNEIVVGPIKGVLLFKLNDKADVEAFDALLLMATIKIDLQTRKSRVKGEPYICSYAIVLADTITAIDEKGVHAVKGAKGICFPSIVLGGKGSEDARISAADIKSLELPSLQQLQDLIGQQGSDSRDKETDWCNFKLPRNRSVCGLLVSLERGIPGKPFGEFRTTADAVAFNPDIEVATENGVVKVPVVEIVKY